MVTYNVDRFAGRYAVGQNLPPVATKQDTEIVKPGNNALKFDPIDQEDGQRRARLPDSIQKRVL